MLLACMLLACMLPACIWRASTRVAVAALLRGRAHVGRHLLGHAFELIPQA